MKSHETIYHSVRTLVMLVFAGFILVWNGCASSSQTTADDSNGSGNNVVQEKTSEELTQEMIIAFNLGYDRYQQKDYERALPYLLKTNEIDRQINGEELRYPRIYLQIGRAYFERGIVDSAYIAYSDGLKSNPGNMTFLNWLQWYYLNENRLDEYIQTTLDILNVEEDLNIQKENIVRIKDLLKSRQENEKALELVELLLTLEPDNTALDNERIGLIRDLRGNDALLEEFERRYQQDPTDSEVIWQLISAYSDQSRYDDVIKMADAYIALNPDDIDVRLQKVSAYRSSNRIDDTIKVFMEISQLSPQDQQYLIEIADIYRVDKRNLREALNWASRSRRLNRNYGPANYLIAELIVEYIENTMSKFGRSVPSYEDKLIYEIAVTYFKDAVRDPNTRTDAQRYASFYEENYFRTSEDKFMNKGYDTPRTQEYNWIWRYKR